MKRIEIHKFGGTSVANAERIISAAKLIGDRCSTAQNVVVSSATSGTTDRLLDLGKAALAGNLEEVALICDEIEKKHLTILEQIGGDEKTAAEITGLLKRLPRLAEAVMISGELTARVSDRIVITGEKLAVRLFAMALTQQGHPAVFVDADTFLNTDGHFGEGQVTEGEYETDTQKALKPHLDKGIVPIVTGFCGRSPEGVTVTLGRGGSDLSATLFGAALNADEVTIWTDVDGVFTADPRVVTGAQVLPQLHYKEAAELSFFGAKVLHPRTMIPVASKKIPIRICNTLNPTAEGTIVDSRQTPGSHPVKSVSALKGHALISVEGKGMSGIPGILARMLHVIANSKISVTMISQASSEASICLALPQKDIEKAEGLLRSEFQKELDHRDIEKIDVQNNVALIAVVGIGMSKVPGVAGRTMSALGKANVNILAIAQGSSELNITLAVLESDQSQAIHSLHNAFGLHRVDTGIETPNGLEIVVFGLGKIGQSLIGRLMQHKEAIKKRFDLEMRIVAVADRSGYVLKPKGISFDELQTIIAQKSEGNTLANLPDGIQATFFDVMDEVLKYRFARPIVVDTSDAADSDKLFARAFEKEFDVVTANKIPLAGDSDVYAHLQNLAATNGRIWRAEATVGAGLPVIDTLGTLLATGDKLTSIEGALSGTLGYLMSQLENGVKFSTAVDQALQAGYTEPDPAVDLSGKDVARKGIILGRLAGLVNSQYQLKLEGLVPEDWVGLELAELKKRLLTLDDSFEAKVKAAAAENKTLRFLATVKTDTVTVGPVVVDKDSPAGRLQGTGNLLVFNTEWYSDPPLVITGPGAGVEVTAMGVMGDILKVAAERRGV